MTRRTVLLFAAVLGLTLPAAVPSKAAGVAAEAALVEALSLDARTGERLTPSGPAVRAFIAGGHVGRKPDLRFDYNDYRMLRKPARLFGFTILVLEEEYMAKYVGCCVSPGLGVMLTGHGDARKLAAFARANGCSLEAPADPSGIPAELGLAVPAAGLTYLSCRERDVSR